MATTQYPHAGEVPEGNSVETSEEIVLSARTVRPASVASASPRARKPASSASRPVSQAARRESSRTVCVTAEEGSRGRETSRASAERSVRGWNSQRVLAAFLVPDADGLVNLCEENLAVADFARARGLQD